MKKKPKKLTLKKSTAKKSKPVSRAPHTKKNKPAPKLASKPALSLVPVIEEQRLRGESERRIVIVSDGTGETAVQMTKAAMVQFEEQQNYELVRYKNIRAASQIDAIVDEAQAKHDLIIYTLVTPQLRSLLLQRCHEKLIPCIDLLGPLLGGLASYFGYEPKLIAGLLHDVNERYFKRIAAMEYSIAHDDGRDLTGLENADLVILGISRTSKTPLSMFLSHQGWKVANIPLIRGFDVPAEVYKVDPRRVITLTINPEELLTIRRNRLQRLGSDKGGDYAERDRVIAEIEYADEIFKKNRKWASFNVTGKALEETAAEILKLMAARKLTPPDILRN